MLIGYVRCSTADQNLDLQIDAMNRAGCSKVFQDVMSGAVDTRPGLQMALDNLKSGDTLIVWRLDRLGRSLQHLIEVVSLLKEKGVGLKTIVESLDTTTPGGRLTFHVFGALAEFERSLIQQRTMAGLEAARLRGRIGGRPSKLTDSQVRIAEQLFSERNHSVAEIAQSLGVSRSTLYRNLKIQPPTKGHSLPRSE